MCAVDFTVRQFLLPLSSALVQHGSNVTIACSRGPYFDEIRSAGFDIRENYVSRSMNVFSHAGSIYRTWKLLKREKFDVIHVHTPIAALIGRIAARAAGVPVKIYTAHGFYFHEGMPTTKRFLHIFLERIGAACGNFIMTVSREDEATAIRLKIAKQSQIETIYNGVDITRFSPGRFSSESKSELRSRLAIAADRVVVGFAGRLVREKGIFELLEASRDLIKSGLNIQLLIVGGSLSSDHDANPAQFKARISELELQDRVTVTGLVSDIAPYLAIMDVFCLPSYREGMPVSLLEAMASGLPCVATDIRGCREEIEDGISGLLIPREDSAALSKAIAVILRNSQISTDLGAAARKRVEENFEIGSVVEHQLKIYRRLIADRHPHIKQPS
jgi:glycosyltransferase involved in cell wall biosynthesis